MPVPSSSQRAPRSSQAPLEWDEVRDNRQQTPTPVDSLRRLAATVMVLRRFLDRHGEYDDVHLLTITLYCLARSVSFLVLLIAFSIVLLWCPKKEIYLS